MRNDYCSCVAQIIGDEALQATVLAHCLCFLHWRRFVSAKTFKIQANIQDPSDSKLHFIFTPPCTSLFTGLVLHPLCSAFSRSNSDTAAGWPLYISSTVHCRQEAVCYRRKDCMPQAVGGTR